MKTSAAKLRVAFQGHRGAFSEEAAFKLLGPEIELVPRRTFADLYGSVDDELADYVLAPVENTITGLVQASVERLRVTKLVPVDEVTIRVEQCLIGCPGAAFNAIETVQSHPVALAQCGLFFAANPRLKQITADDTAGSVAEVIRRGDLTRAAIGSRLAAEVYGGSIIRKNIHDHPENDNCTSFVLLGRVTSQKFKDLQAGRFKDLPHSVKEYTS